MIVQEIYDFIKKYPNLKKFLNLQTSRISVDQLDTEQTQYVIQMNPVEPIIEQYNDGSSLRRCTFDLTSNELLDAETLQNIENNNFYEDLSAWLDKQTYLNLLPMNWHNIQAVSNGFLFDETDAQHGLYRITIELIYYKDI